MELDEIQVQQIFGAFKILNEFCSHRIDCMHCPFEKVNDDGSGTCKFRLESGLPAYMLCEILTGPVIDDEEEDENDE